MAAASSSALRILPYHLPTSSALPSLDPQSACVPSGSTFSLPRCVSRCSLSPSSPIHNPTPRSRSRESSSSSSRRPVLAQQAPAESATADRLRHDHDSQHIVDVHSRGELEALYAEAAPSKKLLVVEYTMESLPNTAKHYEVLRGLSRESPDVQFVRVMADKGEDLKQVLVDAGVQRIPSFSLFKGGERVHDATGMDAQQLKHLLLYYSEDPTANKEGHVHQLESSDELTALIEDPANEGKLIVVKAACNFCEPCARIYPVVLNLAHRMASSAHASKEAAESNNSESTNASAKDSHDSMTATGSKGSPDEVAPQNTPEDVVFARFFGDANPSTAKLMLDFEIVEAPTFLFYRNKESLGRYVGSAGGDLIGEILKRQGVMVS